MNIFYGLVLAIAAGSINGLHALPMKWQKKWAWENIWLPFSILALLIFPWVINSTAAPGLVGSLEQIPSSTILIAMAWGILVYSGSLLFGLSFSYIGIALAFTLLVGSMSVVGILIPILIYDYDIVFTHGGKLILAGIG